MKLFRWINYLFNYVIEETVFRRKLEHALKKKPAPEIYSIMFYCKGCSFTFPITAENSSYSNNPANNSPALWYNDGKCEVCNCALNKPDDVMPCLERGSQMVAMLDAMHPYTHNPNPVVQASGSFTPMGSVATPLEKEIESAIQAFTKTLDKNMMNDIVHFRYQLNSSTFFDNHGNIFTLNQFLGEFAKDPRISAFDMKGEISYTIMTSTMTQNPELILEVDLTNV